MAGEEGIVVDGGIRRLSGENADRLAAGIDGKWYYLNENPDGTKGARPADTWIGEYYVYKDGRWDEKRKRS